MRQESGRATSQRLLCTAALLALLSAGCAQRQAAPPPMVGEQQGKRSGLSRMLNLKPDAPGYGWDGQVSSMAVKAPVNVVFSRASEVLRAMGFSMKTEETRREGTNGRISAAKADKTLASIALNETTPGVTEVRVKVGAVGERTGSERILDDLQKALQKPAPKPVERVPARSAQPAPKGDALPTR